MLPASLGASDALQVIYGSCSSRHARQERLSSHCSNGRTFSTRCYAAVNTLDRPINNFGDVVADSEAEEDGLSPSNDLLEASGNGSLSVQVPSPGRSLAVPLRSLRLSVGPP